METAKVVFVGYSTSVRDDAGKYYPEFQPNRSDKSDAAKEATVARKTGEFHCKAPNIVFLANIDKAVIMSTNLEDCETFKREGDKSVGYRMSEYIRDNWLPKFASTGQFDCGAIRLIGFDIRSFIKVGAMLAAEDGMPWPHGLWYGAEHRDMVAMLYPDSAKDISMTAAWDRLDVGSILSDDFRHSVGLGIDPGLDALFSMIVACKLSLYPDILQVHSNSSLDAAVISVVSKLGLERLLKPKRKSKSKK